MSLDWKYFTDNLKKNDLPFLDRKDIDENDLRRIWKDILLHEELALEYAKKTGEVNKARTEIEKIKEEFHRKIKNRRFYTSWETEKIIEDLKPLRGSLDKLIELNRYTEDKLMIDVVCAEGIPKNIDEIKNICNKCIEQIEAFTGCKEINRKFGEVEMECKVNERKIPVKFVMHTYLGNVKFSLKDNKLIPYDYEFKPSISRIVRDAEYFG